MMSEQRGSLLIRRQKWIFVLVFAAYCIATTGDMVVRAAEEKPVLAIISGDDLGAEVDLLTAGLSRSDELVLVERAKVNELFREQKLSLENAGESSRIGQMLKADGLIIVDKTTQDGKDVIVSRLVSVNQGAVLGTVYGGVGGKDADTWRKAAQDRFCRLLPKLKVRKEAGVAISLLNIRAVEDSAVSRQLESELTALFAHRLMREKSVFVLERWRMESLGWEKQLGGDVTNQFWTGSYLLDGLVSVGQGGKRDEITVKLRLKKRDQKESTVEGAGSREKLSELVEQLTLQLLKLLDRQAEAIAWDQKSEAAQYLKEAQWAINAGLVTVAIPASESAWVLGARGRDAELARVRAYIGAAGREALDGERRLDWCRTAMEYFSDYAKGGPVDVPLATGSYEFLGAKLLEVAGENLFIRSVAGKPEVSSEKVAEVRRLARLTYDSLENSKVEKWSFFHWEVMHYAAIHGGLWQETPEAARVFYRKFLTAVPGNGGYEREARRHAKQFFLRRRVYFKEAGYAPVAMDWQKGERCDGRVLSALVEDFSRSGKVEDRISAMALKICDKEIMPGATFGERDMEQFRALYKASAEKLVKGDVAHDDISVLVEYVMPDKATCLGLLREMFAATAHEKAMQSCLAGELVNRLSRQLSEEETRELFDAVDAKCAKGVKDEQHLQEKLARKFPAIAAARKAGGAVLVATNFWSPDSRPAGGCTHQAVRWAKDGLWCLVYGKNFTLYRVEPGVGRVLETITIPAWKPAEAGGSDRCSAKECFWSIRKPDVFVEDDSIIVLGPNFFTRYDRRAKSFKGFDLPWRGFEGSRRYGAAGDYFYTMSWVKNQSSMIMQLDTRTGATTMLASSRRKPKEGPLDDVAQYEVKNVVSLASNRVAFLVYDTDKSEVLYMYSVKDKTWERIYQSAQKGSARKTPEGILVGNYFDFVQVDPFTKEKAYLWKTRNSPDGGRTWRWPGNAAVLPHVPGLSENSGYEGGTLYVLCQKTRASEHRNAIYRLRGAASEGGVLIPVEFTCGDEVVNFEAGWVPRILAVPGGLVFWRENMTGFWFVSEKEFEAFVAKKGKRPE